jgi:hypothetical protein
MLVHVYFCYFKCVFLFCINLDTYKLIVLGQYLTLQSICIHNDYHNGYIHVRIQMFNFMQYLLAKQESVSMLR